MDEFRYIKIVLAVVIVLLVVSYWKASRHENVSYSRLPATTQAANASETVGPKLIELGSVSCLPCKMMKPILAELEKEFAGELSIEFIDVNKYQSQVSKYNIKVIPTQIFLNDVGEEIFRHEGFFGKAEIIEKFRENGIDLKKRKTDAGLNNNAAK